MRQGVINRYASNGNVRMTCNEYYGQMKNSNILTWVIPVTLDIERQATRIAFPSDIL